MNRRKSFFLRRQPSDASPTSNGTAVANGANGNANGHSVEESHQSLSGPAAAPKILQGLREQVAKGANVLNTSVLSSVVDTIRHRDSIDDRTLALEHGISFVSKMPEGKLATTMQNKIIELFHATNIGNQYAWRTADGGQNNVNVPDMGRAGTPYARSVQQSHPLPKHEMPDASLVFDALLKRDGFVQHPAGLSSLMFSFAALVIHSVFRTSHTDVNVNETSSYVDLSPLYGVDQTEQDRVRRKEAGLGLLHPDVFAEDRLLLLPPAVCGLLVLFSRNHNYIANRIYEINERGTYADPTTLPEEKRAAQDEELFQTARLVNCGWFGSVVFSDYFSAILGLVREGSSWSLNPFGEFRSEDHAIFDRGQGNVCSVEFNCLYRWHATTSQQDEAWVGKVFDDIFDGKAPEEVTPTDFKAAAYKVKKMQPDITHWTFGKLERQADGSFKDEDLANIIKNATDNPAGAFRARGTPASMRLHEMMGIEQNRKWGVCSLNDFRRYLGLKPYASFKEWNPKSEIYEAAEKLYGDIEYLELYVGLQAEEPKPVVEGAGLCPGYTISRAILADAIALTRGDRHFTYDYTPHNLTAWGFADCQRDPHAYGFGSTLGRLFLRTLPNSFTEDSSYAFFPLMTPTAMKTNLTKLHKLEGYDLTRPKDMPPPMIIQDYAQVAEALKSTKYTTAYAARAGRVVKGKGFFIVESDEKRKEVYTKLFGSSDSLDKVATFFRDTTRQLMASATFTLVGGKTCVVDVVRDVLKLVPVYWAAEIAGIELKTKLNPSGSFTPIDLYDMLADIYSFVFLDIEKSKIKVTEARVQTHVDKLLQHVGISRLSVVGTLFKSKKTEQHDLVKCLREIGRPSATEVANMVLAVMVASTAEMSLKLTNMVNLYLGTEHQDKIRSTAVANGVLDGYVREASRLDPPFRGVFRLATANEARVFVDIAAASVNADCCPNPNVVDPTRKANCYLYADGSVKSLGEAFSLRVVSEVVKTVFSYKNLKRAPGQSGALKRFSDGSRLDLRFAYLDEKKFSSPWPTSMAVQYDA